MPTKEGWGTRTGVVVLLLVSLIGTGCSRAKPSRSLLPAVASEEGSSGTGADPANAAVPTASGLLVLPAGALSPDQTQDAAAPPADLYMVRRGDTLLSIAEAHGTTVEALMAANALADADALLVGQELRLPMEGSGTVSHVVQPGETLMQLARQYRTTAAAIAAANPSAVDPGHLAIGQVLRIPLGAVPTLRMHIVRAGESVYGIAREYGVPVADIVSANQVSDPAHVTVGQVLVIP